MQTEAFETLLSKNQIPIIDLSKFTDLKFNSTSTDLEKLASELQKAISETGLALLINHGISKDNINKVWKYFDLFLASPDSLKEKFKRSLESNWGYTQPGVEMLDRKNPLTELKHSYDIIHVHEDKFPKELDGFLENVTDLVKDFKSVTHLLLKAVALALDIPSNFFIERHQKILSGNDENGSAMRLLYYPPVNETNRDKVIRCGEHKDYGTFTLLDQDSEGGLEIKLPGRDWERVGFLPGSILINCGELLAMWTKDKFPAVNHRVVVPEQNTIRCHGRHSLAFFVHPDHNVRINSAEIFGTEESNSEIKTYTAKEHLEKRFAQTLYY